jgi:ABC-2 type transport system permease protein
MKPIITLVKREFWEQRATFLYLPLLLTTLVAFFFTLFFFRFATDEATMVSGNQIIEGLQGFAAISREDKALALDGLYTQISSPLLLVLWLVLIFYFFNTLYQEKKDRSILFWKSMPVSDAYTVMSKLLAGLALAPAIFFACLVCLHLVALLVMTGGALLTSVEPWTTFWVPSDILGRLTELTLSLIMAVLWSLPVYAWILATSSWARSAPFAWATGLPVLAVGMELLYLGSSRTLTLISQHALPVAMFNIDRSNRWQEFAELLNVELLASVLLAAVFTYVAVVFRARSAEL